MTRLSLIAFLGASSGCVVTRDFCVVVTSEIAFDPATAAAVVATDRGEAEQIDAQNTYWRENC
ncbi:MAG: hypothetical protein AAFY43_01715 [Pseudomonadota bacterium]